MLIIQYVSLPVYVCTELHFIGIVIVSLTGIDIDKAEEDEEIPPLFATQINDEVLWGKERPLEEDEDISKLDEGLSVCRK